LPQRCSRPLCSSQTTNNPHHQPTPTTRTNPTTDQPSNGLRSRGSVQKKQPGHPPDTVTVDGPRSVPSGPNRVHPNPTHPPKTRSTPQPPPKAKQLPALLKPHERPAGFTSQVPQS